MDEPALVVQSEDPGLGELVKGMVLKNADDEVLAYESHRLLDEVRQAAIATAFPECKAPKKVVAIIGKAPSGGRKENIAVCQEGAQPKVVVGTCQITYEDISPSECVEFAFAEAPGTWAMAQLSLEALETYRSMKFEAWKSMLVSPTCEAQFRRMLQIGMVSQLYDPHVFPTPESQKAKYQVTDERTGKLIELPHPVSALRVWDCERQDYRTVDTQLKGAPTETEKAAWWSNFLKELSDKHGQEYIEGLMAGK